MYNYLDCIEIVARIAYWIGFSILNWWTFLIAPYGVWMDSTIKENLWN